MPFIQLRRTNGRRRLYSYFWRRTRGNNNALELGKAHKNSARAHTHGKEKHSGWKTKKRTLFLFVNNTFNCCILPIDSIELHWTVMLLISDVSVRARFSITIFFMTLSSHLGFFFSALFFVFFFRFFLFRKENDEEEDFQFICRSSLG